jgi:hypothetical protein
MGDITQIYVKGDCFALYSDEKSCPRPIMAVLVRSESISGLQKQMAAPRIRSLAEANKEVNNILYFFSPRQVKLKERKISGYYWHKKKNRWLRRDFSFPDVFYIRCPVGKRYTQTIKDLSNMITKNNGKIISHDRFNKWLLYKIMSKDPVIKKYLPMTRTVRKPNVIRKMLQRYKVVYLKSHIGRMGKNVLRVEAHYGGGYQYSYYRSEQLTAGTVADFPALMNIVNKFFRGRKFLIQQGIELLKINNRFIDMRAELQHNGDGGVEIVGISVRLGQPRSPITTHGDAIAFNDFYIKKMGYSKEQLEAFRSVVQKFLTGVYEFINNNYSKYAEMGIDFAIDKNKKIWFIEANAKSTHVSLNKAYGKKVLFRYNKNILEYARYLSNQSQLREFELLS